MRSTAFSGRQKAKSPLVRAGFRLPFLEEIHCAPARRQQRDEVELFNRRRNAIRKEEGEDIDVNLLPLPYALLERGAGELNWAAF
ncbi:hypothetical protein [Paraburkholderia caffeinilytica]|uniref:hypothetical protein n=1 Tax=Paraburkholderia caffeinilytica TaxID=1761016 RepID=UPI0013BE9273|nr:hypothetical protein [Paraburkholderia caffeinilytica]